VEIPALKADRELVRQGLALMNVDYAQTAEIAILGAERAVINRDFANQLRAEGLERSQISLTVSLRALVLLDIVDQHFETAIHTAMVQVESEAPDLERFAAAFMLAGIDTCIELLQYLIVAREERSIKDLRVTQVHLRLKGVCHDHHALMLRRNG